MSDNLVLASLEAIRADLADLKTDVRDMKHRLSALEIGVAGLRRDIAGLYEPKPSQPCVSTGSRTACSGSSVGWS